MDLEEFIQQVKLLRITGTLQWEEHEDSIYPLFILISKKSKLAIPMSLDLCQSFGTRPLLYSLITFFGRVLASDDIVSSANYQLLLSRCRKMLPVYRDALEKLTLFDNYNDSLKIIYLLERVLS